MSRWTLLASLLLVVGCMPEEPAWQEGELGRWEPGLTVGAGEALTTKLVEHCVNCLLFSLSEMWAVA